MARPCEVCTHAARTAIDSALVSGSAVRVVEKRYPDISKSALNRHAKAHIERSMARASAIRTFASNLPAAPEVEYDHPDVIAANQVLAALAKHVEHGDEFVRAAFANGTWREKAAALRESRETLTLRARLAGMLNESTGTVVNDQRTQVLQVIGSLSEAQLRALSEQNQT